MVSYLPICKFLYKTICVIQDMGKGCAKGGASIHTRSYNFVWVWTKYNHTTLG